MMTCCPAEDTTIFVPILQLEDALAVFLLLSWQNSGVLSKRTLDWDSWPYFGQFFSHFHQITLMELNFSFPKVPGWISTKKSSAEQRRVHGEAGEEGESQQHHV